MRLRLRGRLGLSLGALLAAQLAALFAWDLASRKDAAARTLARIALHAVDDADEREACAADPAGFDRARFLKRLGAEMGTFFDQQW